MPTKKIPAFVRINSRVRADQHAFIKKAADISNKTEGEIHRIIIDYYMDKKGKKKNTL